MDTKIAGILALVLVVVLGGYTLTHKPVVQEVVGAQAGPEHGNAEFFHSTITVGGSVFATSSQGAATYTAASLQNTSLIKHTAPGALTVTLPASSTLTNFARNPGDVRTIFISAITTNITLAGGTGTDIDTASTTKNCNVGAICRLDFIRKADTDFEVLLTTGA